MMINENQVREIILRALQSLCDELPVSEKFEIGPSTPLFGHNATLDSLSLVSVIVDVEGDVSIALGRSISLTDDRAMSQGTSPFDDVQTLLEYIMLLVNEA
jgi:hypothetical protein